MVGGGRGDEERRTYGGFIECCGYSQDESRVTGCQCQREVCSDEGRGVSAVVGEIRGSC